MSEHEHEWERVESPIPYQWERCRVCGQVRERWLDEQGWSEVSGPEFDEWQQMIEEKKKAGLR